MKRPICVKCQIPFRNIKSGVSVIDMFSSPSKPYKIWHADLFECPICKVQIVNGFADRPFAHHFEADFERRLLQSGGDSPVYNYEHIEDALRQKEAG